MKICTKCEVNKKLDDFYPSKCKRDGKSSWCKECHKQDVINRQQTNKGKELERKRSRTKKRRQYIKQWRIKTRHLYRERYNARAKVYRAVKSGKLKRQKCEVCGKRKTEAHHPDYSKPFKVVWLCRKHHLVVEKS